MTIDGDLQAVLRYVTRERLLDAVQGLVNIASPTGGEGELARWIAQRLASKGIRAEVQRIDAEQSNAVGVLPGRGDGPAVLLYAPIDTFTTGNAALDVPAAAPVMRPDMLPRAEVHGELVQGLGAGNPKGHAACVLVALEALTAAGVELPGDVVAGFGAGGMPTFATEEHAPRTNTGHGVGASFLLERGYTTDCAIIAKPGFGVAHEEVGFVWLDVVVPGTHTYVGSRHRLPYRNAVALAGRVAIALEDWLEGYAERNEHGTMRPQGVVSSVRGGFDRLAASTPAEVRLRLDLRITHRQTPAEVTREVRGFVRGLGKDLDADIEVRQVATIPATITDPAAPVIRATVAAWQSTTGDRHTPIKANSGATDANILRMRGVPTARIGMPKVVLGPAGTPPDFTLGMNLIDLTEARRLVEILVRAVFELQGRSAGTP